LVFKREEDNKLSKTASWCNALSEAVDEATLRDEPRLYVSLRASGGVIGVQKWVQRCGSE